MSNIEEELAIRTLVARYIDAVNRHHQEDWTATWAEDAVWNLAGLELEGRDTIVGAWVGGYKLGEKSGRAQMEALVKDRKPRAVVREVSTIGRPTSPSAAQPPLLAAIPASWAKPNNACANVELCWALARSRTRE